MTLRFDGRAAIVTGAGRGLGKQYAEALAERGCSVLVNDPGVALDGSGGDRTVAEEVVATIRAAGGNAVPHFEPVGSEQAAQALVQRAVDSFGRIDILINNAGNFLPATTFLETSSASFQRLLDTHLFGSLNLMRAAWPHMTARRYGKIVNVASHVGYIGTRGRLEYGTAKAALHGLTRCLSHESLDVGIYCNILAPAAVTRPVVASMELPDEVRDAFAVRLVSPTVLWLAHEDCKVNGESFTVMAGTTARIVIAETEGFFSRSPSVEEIRDNFDAIRNVHGQLRFPSEGEEHGRMLIARYMEGKQ